MKIRLILLSLLIPLLANAQDTLSLQDCLEDVVENSPRLRDKSLIDEQGQLTMENIQANWYPQLMLNGKVSYQSDVVALEISDPSFPFSFPTMPNEQFGLNIDLHQTLYDGGLSKQKKEYERARIASEIQKVDVDIYALKERVTSLYFSILMLQENRANLEIALENLKTREKMLTSAVTNGVAMEADLKIIRVEIMKVLQAVSELDAARIGAMKALSVYTGKDIDAVTLLASPFLEIDSDPSMVRPELVLFDLQAATLDAGKNMVSAKRLPQVFAYGQAGVGMPGYNMLNDQVDTYFMVGAGLKWNIWDWNTGRREKQILENKILSVENSKEQFSMNIQAGIDKELEIMEHYSDAIRLDDKMLEMRMDITGNASSQLDNGVISASEYVLVLNEESLTRINRTKHKLQLMKAIANYNLLKGTL